MKTNFKNNLAPAVIELNRMNEELQAENSQLKKDLEHARSYKHTIKMRNRNLQAEIERLKGEREEANSWDDSWKMAERITQLEKCLVNSRKDNAKLKCLNLLLASEMYWFKSLCNKYEGSDWWVKMKRQSVYYRKAYRKSKKALMEGK